MSSLFDFDLLDGHEAAAHLRNIILLPARCAQRWQDIEASSQDSLGDGENEEENPYMDYDEYDVLCTISSQKSAEASF
jgi:hypothetical protein